MRNRRSQATSSEWDETTGGTIAYLVALALTLGATLGMVAALASEAAW